MKRKAAIEIIERYRDIASPVGSNYAWAYYVGVTTTYDIVLEILAKDANADDFLTKGDVWSPEVGAKVAVERNGDTFDGGEVVFIDPDPDTANPVRVIFSDGEDVWAPLCDVHPLDADAGE